MELKKAKQILNKNKGEKYTDEQIIEILKLLDVLVEISVNNFLKSLDKIHNNKLA
jgi:hypothetical protein